MITTKRAYEPESDRDGYRALIDRLWPRGVSRARASHDAWEKAVGPRRARRGRVTLVYGSRAKEISDVAVLEGILRKPSTRARGSKSEKSR
jgi:uncharacterized protein YeaO (DUF488 family)